MGGEREIRGNVASLRLDSVASLGFGISRTKMADDIKEGRVQLNGKPVFAPGRSVRVGDVISLRGRGSVSVAAVLGETKRGRINLLLKRHFESRGHFESEGNPGADGYD